MSRLRVERIPDHKTEPMVYDKNTAALSGIANEWFMANFLKGEHGSLQIVGEDATGKRHMFKIFATDDEDMFRKAKAAIGQVKAVRFVAHGEGEIRDDSGDAVKVFLMYVQQPGSSAVRRLVMPYEREGAAYRLAADWSGYGYLTESWLDDPAPPRPASGWLSFGRRPKKIARDERREA